MLNGMRRNSLLIGITACSPIKGEGVSDGHWSHDRSPKSLGKTAVPQSPARANSPFQP